MITFAREASGAEKTLNIDDAEDAAFLCKLFGKEHTAEYDSPCCSCGRCRISFVPGRERIDFYPAMDDCEFVRYKGKKFVITPQEKGKLKDICRRYDKKRRQQLR